MNQYKILLALIFMVSVPAFGAMNTRPRFEQEQRQPVQQQSEKSFKNYFIPSSRAVKMGLISTAFLSGQSLVYRFFTGRVLPLWPQPLPMRLFNYTLSGLTGGQYIVDEDRGGKRCYASQSPWRYQYLQKRYAPCDAMGMPLLEPRPDAIHSGWSSRYATLALIKEVGTDLLLSKLIPMAGSFSFGQKAGALIALGVAKPGLLGVAALVGVNLASVFGLMATKYAVEKLVVNPLIKPVLIRVANTINRRVWGQQKAAALPI